LRERAHQVVSEWIGVFRFPRPTLPFAFQASAGLTGPLPTGFTRFIGVPDRDFFVDSAYGRTGSFNPITAAHSEGFSLCPSGLLGLVKTVAFWFVHTVSIPRQKFGDGTIKTIVVDT
jgi:hypothetical protein